VGSKSRTDRPGRPGEKHNRDKTRGRTRPSSTIELLYGRNAVAEALAGQRRALRLYIAEGIRRDARVQAIERAARQSGVPIDSVPRLRLDEIAAGSRHQGIALEASPFRYADPRDFQRACQVILVLDHLQDPQNVGAILRTAEAFGVDGCLLPKDRAAGITPAVVNASAGAVEHLRVAQVTNLTREIDNLREAGFWIIGLDRFSRADALETFSFPLPAVLVIGSEDRGISRMIMERCDAIVSITQTGSVESLNASVAAAIALHELTRSRRVSDFSADADTRAPQQRKD
jgi:23S rRNA (guanosine2251-2'-O)-methyltransferase